MSAPAAADRTRPGTVVRLDSALGRVATYRLVVLSLAALAVISIVESLAGLIGPAPLPLVLTLVVAVVASVVGSRIMGALVRATPQTRSALVTGLLLFFILTPSDTLGGLLIVAAAAFVASASKFLVRLGGRHVLNPAAAGAFVVGLTGVSGSAWWIATGPLLPFVAVLGLVVAIRVRLVGPALVLVAVGAALETIGQLAYGSAVLDGLGSALVSSPLVFLAAFMFSEPFTLPPRRWQRYAVAAVVGVVLGAPYFVVLSLGPLGFSPELALLVGNVVSVLAARPASADLRFAGRRPLSPTAIEYSFTPTRPLTHRAGQYLELHLPHRDADRGGVRRTFTIVSPPNDPSGEVKVAMRVGESASSFKRALEVLPLGSPVRATTVGGEFTLPRDRSVPVLLVASGIGITPFVSQLKDEAAAVAAGAAPRDVLVVDRVTGPDEILYSDVLEASGARVLLVGAPFEAWHGVPLPDHWHVAERLDVDALASVLPDPAARVAYLAGSPRFVASARETLKRAGVRRVRTDAFAGY